MPSFEDEYDPGFDPGFGIGPSKEDEYDPGFDPGFGIGPRKEDEYDPGFDPGFGIGPRKEDEYDPGFDPGFGIGPRKAFERPYLIDGGEGTDAELFDWFRRRRQQRRPDTLPRENFQYGQEESPVQNMGGMFQVPPEPSARVGNPMFPADAAQSFIQSQRRPLNVFSGGLQAQAQPYVPIEQRASENPIASLIPPAQPWRSPSPTLAQPLVPFEKRDPARPLVNFMPPAQQRRSPSPMTYEEPRPASALAENPEFPQGQGPLQKFGESGSQLMGDYERGAYTRMKNERLRELADEINAKNGVRNPMVPNSPLRLDESGRQLPPIDPTSAAMKEAIREGRRVDEFLEGTPIATSSGEARRNAQSVPPDLQNPMTMRPGSGYNGNIGYANDPNRPSPEDNFQSAQQSAEFQSGNRVRPGNDAFGDRFRQEPGPGYDGPRTRELKRIEALKATPEYQARAAEYAKQKTARESLRNRDNPAATEEEAKRRIAANAQAAARAAKHQAFKDANGGMNYRQYDRMTGSSNGNNSLTMKAVREGRLSPAEAEYRMQLRAEKALRRSGNPVAPGTSQAGILYPDLMGRQRGARADQNPMAQAAEAMRPGGNRTAEGKAAAKSYLKTAFAGGADEYGTTVPPNAFLKDTGATGEEDNIETMHFGIQKLVQEDVSPSDDDLQAVYAAVVAMDSAYGTPTYDPFDMTYGVEFTGTDKKHTEVFGPMYKDLLKLKNPKPSDLQAWWAKFKSKIANDTEWGTEDPVAPPGIPPGVTRAFPEQY
jgi:hypothetical protein